MLMTTTIWWSLTWQRGWPISEDGLSFFFVFFFCGEICSCGYDECRNAYSLSACNTVWCTGASSCNDAEFSHDVGMAEACVLTVTIEISQGCSSCCEADCGLVGQDIALGWHSHIFFMKYILIISSLVIFRIAFCPSCCPTRVLHASTVLSFTIWFLPISGHSAYFSGGQQHTKAAIREEATLPSAMIYIPST